MQITVNETNLEIKDGKLIINIDSNLEKLLGLNNIQLSTLEVGAVFRDNTNVEYIVLEQFNNGTTAVLRKNLLEREMSFGDNNDWRSSKIRKYLNNEYLKTLENTFGKEYIVEHVVDLLSLDGLDDYGKSNDKVSLFTINQYRKYRKVIGENMSSWWWLATPDSTPSGHTASYVRSVHFGGDVMNAGAGEGGGAVRPFFILKSSIFVSLSKKQNVAEKVKQVTIQRRKSVSEAKLNVIVKAIRLSVSKKNRIYFARKKMK